MCPGGTEGLTANAADYRMPKQLFYAPRPLQPLTEEIAGLYENDTEQEPKEGRREGIAHWPRRTWCGGHPCSRAHLNWSGDGAERLKSGELVQVDRLRSGVLCSRAAQ